MSKHRTLAEEFIRVTERLGWTDELAKKLLHADYAQTEFPNLLNRRGQKSNLAETIARNELARKILSSQTFTITSLVEAGSTVVIEASWSGTMAVDVGPLAAGQRLGAHFCMVFEFEGGLIHRVRNRVHRTARGRSVEQARM
jgi:hypothetical protein